MAQLLYINNTLIDDEDIAEPPKQNEAMAYDGAVTIPDELEVLLDNTDRTAYDDRYVGSLFYGAAVIGTELKYYDDVIKRYIFKGKIKNLTIDDSSNQITVTASSRVSDLSNIPCNYIYNGDRTPAEHIYRILVDVAGIDEADIVYAGFQDAINLQDANSCYVDLSLDDGADSSNTKDCGQVIAELVRVSHCHLFTYQNLIYLWQWKPYAGQLGEPIYNRDILPKTYKHYYPQKGSWDIQNSYRIGYDNGGAIAWVSGTDTASITQYGENRFLVPNEQVDSSASVDYVCLFRNATGAAWSGAQAIARYKRLTRLCEFTMSGKLDHIHVGTQVDLRFTPYQGEACLVLEREVDKKADTIHLVCLFLNAPYRVFARDVTPPDPPELVSAFPTGGGVLLKWSVDQTADHAGYKIYFTSTKGEWFIDICNLGQSPVDRKPTALTKDGFHYQLLTQLESGTEYSFYVTAYDTTFNESEPSNILTAAMLDDILENTYRLAGNPYFTSLTIDEDNGLSGVPLSTWTLYGSAAILPITLSPASIWVGPIWYKQDGWSRIAWRASGRVYFQYCTSEDNITWTAWSTAIDAVSTSSQLFSAPIYLQVRFFFDPVLWTVADYLYLKELT